jgi:hypothetical protein
MQRKAYIELISYDMVEITTPFRQKKFQLDKDIMGIDLIDLKEIKHYDPSTTNRFFLVIERRESEVIGAAFGYDTSNILTPIGTVGLGVPELGFPKSVSVKTVVIDD